MQIMSTPPDERWDKPIFKHSLLADHKATYVKKDKKYTQQNRESCIICGIINSSENVESYEICRTNKFILYLNLYPFTNAHVLISPLEHKVNYEEMDDDDLYELAIIIKRSAKVLKHNGNTDSLNVGWNQGPIAGGSIKHFHIHLVPRYANELNYMEIIARTRPFIRSLDDTLADLKRYIPYFKGEKSFDEILSNVK